MDTIVLASNACKEIYGGINKPNHFFVNLPQTIKFKEGYGVCLREITYSSTIPTIVNETMTVVVKNHDDEDIKQISTIMTLFFRSGEYITQSSAFKYDGNKHLYDFHYHFTGRFPKYDYYFLSVSNLPSIFNLSKVLPSIEYTKDGELAFYAQSASMDEFLFEKPTICNLELFGANYNFTEHVLKIPSGKYETLEQLIILLNHMLSRFESKFVILNGKLSLESPDSTKLYLHKGLHFILGYKQDILHDDYKVAEYYPDLTRGIFAMFVYLNIVKEMMVGDKMVPLLRTIHIPSTKYGTTVHQIIENPIYVPLNRTCINEIEVMVCDDIGELIPFTSGKCLLMLHFKKL